TAGHRRGHRAAADSGAGCCGPATACPGNGGAADCAGAGAAHANRVAGCDARPAVFGDWAAAVYPQSGGICPTASPVRLGVIRMRRQFLPPIMLIGLLLMLLGAATTYLALGQDGSADDSAEVTAEMTEEADPASQHASGSEAHGPQHPPQNA